jgi:hypothetical protein
LFDDDLQAKPAYYGVTDQALPLGEPPPSDTDWTAPKWAWRARLEHDIEELDLGGDA